MGVHGLWRLIEPSGKIIPLEALENKILAVDISIWLHQAVKGFQDSRGAQLPNAHLLGLYHRLCKLLYFRIRPIFVFDGGVPVLKKQTIAKRNQQKSKILNEANDIQSKLLNTILKHSAVKKVLSEKTNNPLGETNQPEATENDIFKLPEPQTELASIDSGSSSDEYSPTKQWDLHTIDEKSEHFMSLPADVRHDILTEIMETRKQSSWGKIHELPKESKNFSAFQMKRLLKRYSVQEALEKAQNEMGGHSLSLGELEAMLNAEGIVTTSESSANSRIASNEDARYLLIKDVKKAMKAEKQNERPSIADKIPELPNDENTSKDDEFEDDLAAAIQLSLQEQPSTSKDEQFSYMENFNDADFESSAESDNENMLPLLEQAKGYMMEYTGLTPNEIAKIINENRHNQKPSKGKPNVEKNTNVEKNISNDISETKTTPESNENKDIPYLPTIAEEVDIESNLKEIPILNENKISENNKIKEDPPFSTNEKAVLVEETFLPVENNDGIQTLNNSATPIDTEVIEIAKEPKTLTIEIHEYERKGNKTQHHNYITILREDNGNMVKDTNIVKANIVDDDLNNSVQIMSDSDDSDHADLIEVSSTQSSEPIVNIVTKDIPVINDNLRKALIKSQSFSNVFNLRKQPCTSEKNEFVNTETADVVEEVHIKNITDSDKNKDKIVNIDQSTDKVPAVIEPPKRALTVAELNDMESDLIVDQQRLIMERNAKERMAGNISDHMYQEAQELLELFGVPYVTAPMEAEAQCAFLNDINLTDGTITDDSDIWLFGGRTVYKNFFNQKKHVMEFRSENIEHHFKLSREQLILLALLVGSDYTLGIQGIGPVTALEILASFPTTAPKNVSVITQGELLSGLISFKNWLVNGKAVGVGRTALRSKLRNVNIAEGFPNLQVVQAYLQPKVDTCADRFTWGKLNVNGLIEFAREKFGWSKLKSEEILNPVVKKLEVTNIQKSIKDYFLTKHKISGDFVENKMSKRVKMAVKRIANKTEDSSTDVESNKPGKTRKQSQRSSKEAKSKTITPRNKKSVRKMEKNIQDVIPQKERDKVDALKHKLKAIEVFRKSKQGPGFVKKRQRLAKELKESNLSESSSSEE